MKREPKKYEVYCRDFPKWPPLAGPGRLVACVKMWWWLRTGVRSDVRLGIRRAA